MFHPIFKLVSLISESDDVCASVIVVKTSFGEVSQLVKNIL
jgi:hypothetical protein